MHRQQLQRSDAEFHQVCDRLLGGEPRVRAAEIIAYARMAHRESLHVRLVDDGIGERDPWRPVALPEERVIDHDRFRDRGGVVLVVELEVIVRRPVGDVWQDVGVASPVDHPLDRLGVRIDQQLGGVEAMTFGRRVGTVHPVAVALTGTDPWQVAVPVERLALAHLDRHLVALLVEQAQLYALGVLREQREVGAAAVPRRTQRERSAWPDLRQMISAPDNGGSLMWPSRRLASSAVAIRTRSPSQLRRTG